MKILTVGDSWTYGEGSSDPTTKSWPAILSRKYGVEVVNLAEPGCSNQRAFRKGIEELAINPIYDYTIWPIGPAGRKEFLSVGAWAQAWPSQKERINEFTKNANKFFLQHWHPWNDVIEVIHLAYQLNAMSSALNTKLNLSCLSFFVEKYTKEISGIKNYNHDYKFAEVGLSIDDLNLPDEPMHKTVVVLQTMLRTLEENYPDILMSVGQCYLELPEIKNRYNYKKIVNHPCDQGYEALADYYAKKINLI